MKTSTYRIDVKAKITELDPANSPMYNTADDISSAQLFKAVFGKCLRYNATAKTWYVYDGVRWKPDPGDMTVERYAKQLSRSLWLYSADIQSREFQNYVCQLQQRRRRRTMIDDARDLLPVLQTDFDTDPYLFNCQNCVLNLKNHTVMNHDPDLLLSKVANVSYDPDASSTVFEGFMNEIMQGDLAKIEYLQTLFGYSAVFCSNTSLSALVAAQVRMRALFRATTSSISFWAASILASSAFVSPSKSTTTRQSSAMLSRSAIRRL